MEPFGSRCNCNGLNAGARDWLLADFAASGNETDQSSHPLVSINNHLGRCFCLSCLTPLLLITL